MCASASVSNVHVNIAMHEITFQTWKLLKNLMFKRDRERKSIQAQNRYYSGENCIVNQFSFSILFFSLSLPQCVCVCTV